MPTPAPSPLRDRLGWLLDRLGLLALPLALGAGLGFYASDQGVRLLPTMLGALSLSCVAGVALMLTGKLLRGRAFVETPQGLRLRRRVVGVLILAGLAGTVRIGVFATQQPSPLTSLAPDALAEAWQLDAQRYRDLDRGMDGVLRRLEAQPWLGPDAPQEVLSTEQEAMLVDSFAQLWAMTIEQDQIRSFYEDWYRFDPSRVQRPWHLRSFLLTFAAELSVHDKAARLARLVLPNPNASKLLDMPRPELGLPKTAFSIYRQELLGTRDQARVLAGQKYLGVLQTTVHGRTEAAELGLSWLWDRCENHLRTIEGVAPIDRATLLARADSQVLKRAVKRVWFPAQKEVAEQMGDLRVRRIGWYLIGADLHPSILAAAEPGDVLLDRKNWYLSNVALPGFWPHALLYLGPPTQLASWADDDGIRGWIRDQGGGEADLSTFLARRHPAAWARYQAQVDGQPRLIIEAVSEGVVLSTLPEAVGDYFAALRPRLDKRAKAQAIDRALAYLDTPYDFDFDFATDATLVCTELVWRSYQPGPDKQGLDIPLVDVAGRRSLPANELARLVSAQAGAPDRLFDFVLFIDASEHQRKSWISSEPSFLGTADRSRWDVASQ